MGILENLFGQSPFGALLQHTKKVNECVRLVRPLFEILIKEEFDKLDAIHNDISRLEHDADVIKTEIRRGIRRSYFLAVERSDLLQFLHSQDSIADTAEDIAVLLNLRETRIPVELHDELLRYVDLAIGTGATLLKTAESMNILVEKAFGGPERDRVLQEIEALNKQEWEVDRAARHLIKNMFAIEDRLKPLDVVFLLKIFNAVGDLANHAENTGEALALMILRK